MQTIDITNATPAESFRFSGCTLHQVFEVQAAKLPDAVAVVWDNEKLTYGDLNRRANQLAWQLTKKGVRGGTLVAVFMDRSPRTIIAILGILKAGAAYVPIDPVYPDERILWMLSDSGSVAVVSEPSMSQRLVGYSGNTILLGGGYEGLHAENAEPLSLPLHGSTPAYAIYTSGSTGRPKGVLVTHHNVLRLFEATQQWFHFSQNDVWSLFHSFAFDFSVWELWGALLHGGTVVIVPQLTARDPAAFYELLQREEVTILNQTPSAFRQLIWAEENAKTLHLGLRHVIFGGEALELQSLRPWFARHPADAPLLVNMYGITETTVHVTYRPIHPQDLEANAGSVIGIPIPDLAIHLLDESGAPVPEGTPGEIFVGGEGVALGYLHRADLTKQRFVADCFSKRPGARLYRSGDLAKRLPNGDLEYLGRIDHQVKIHGYRIELGEVESALNMHPSVRESVVICDASASEKRLVAYVVPHGTAPSIEELRAFAGRRIPQYMLPARIVMMEKLPLTANGKVDRGALPKPDSTRPSLQSDYTPPTVQEQKIMAEIWQQVLGVDRVGIHDNFFELGGDSIRSIQVLAQAQAKGLSLSLQSLFAHPTIAECVRHLGSDSGEVRFLAPFCLISDEDRKRMPKDAEDAYPIGKLQYGMIYHTDRDKESAIFHDVFSFRFKLPYDGATLQRAVARLVERHPIFRTSFNLESFSEPLQVVHRDCVVPFSEDDLRGVSEAQQKEKLVAWVEGEKRNRFDWSVAPLIRLHVQRYDENTFQFVVSFHHAIMDGWSLAMMLTELFQDYSALLSGQEPRISPPQVRYREFIALENAAINSDASRNYWSKLLENPASNRLPRWPHKPVRIAHEQTRGPEISYPSSLLKALQELARALGVPIRTVLLAAHCRVMNLLTGCDDVLAGLVTNGRPQCRDGERLLGLFLNTVPFRVKLEGDTWQSLIQKVFSAEKGLIPHRRVPLAAIQEIAKAQNLFETAFDFVQFHIYRNLPGYKDHSFLEDHYFEANNFHLYVTFMLNAEGSELQMHFDYNPNEFSSEQIRALCDYYGEALRAMASGAHESCQSAPLLPANERKLLLTAWNNRYVELPAKLPLQLFEEQVDRFPQRTALIFNEVKMTYGELDSHANALARELQKMGVRGDSLVGIYLERCPEMLVSILAVAKAGGAYVPLDPEYPQERLAHIVADADLEATITSRSLAAQAAALNCSRLCMVDDKKPENERVCAAVSGENLAYVIYTSGSTGLPKGVEISRRSLLNLLCAMRKEPGIRGSDHLLALTTLSFDIAGLELWLPLISGATIVLAGTEESRDPAAVAKLLQQHDITVMQATPVMWQALLAAGWPGKRNLVALCGGEALPPRLAQELVDKTCELWNMYGPTETTIWSSISRIGLGEDNVTIGCPIQNTEVYILDPKLNPVPIGTVGEIYIGGDGLSRGYHNRPELTAERFISHPFRTNSRLYRSGDLGRFLPDGRVVCLGRSDTQVKIRGFRIELEEIEVALEQHPSVRKAVVVAQNGSSDTLELSAFFTSSAADPKELRNFLERKLPSYMLPTRWFYVEGFPTTPNGKIDRRRLSSASAQNLQIVPETVGPSSDIERELLELWGQVLGLSELSVTDDFFALGGHSLAAMRIVGRIRNQYQVNLPLASFLQEPTIRALGAQVESLRPSTEALKR